MVRNWVQFHNFMRSYFIVYVFCMLDQVRVRPDLCCEEFTSCSVVGVNVTNPRQK